MTATAPETVSEFESRLSLQSLPRRTAWPYQQILSELREFTSEREGSLQDVGPVELARFLAQRWGEGYSAGTINGHLSRVGTMSALLWNEDPEVCRQKIALALTRRAGRYESMVKVDHLTDSERERTRAFIEWLRERRFGTRLHALVKMIVGTRSRPCLVRAIDLADIDHEQRTVVVKIPKSSLLRQHDIMNYRQSRLPSRSADALRIYCDRTRTTPQQDQQAVFTTPHGRVHRSTVYRELRNKSERVLEDELEDTRCNTAEANEPREPESSQSITPRQLWKYTLDTVQQ